MALSMDEQRVLAEIERRLAAEDPNLAACMTNFRRPGPAAVLRSPRARIIGSLFTVLLVAMISLTVYAMIPFRAHGTRAPAGRTGLIPSQTQLSAASAAGTGTPGRSGTVGASAGARQGSPSANAGTSANGANARATASAATRASSVSTGHASAGPAISVRQTAKGKASGTSAGNR